MVTLEGQCGASIYCVHGTQFSASVWSVPGCRGTGQAIALTAAALCKYWDTGAQDQAGTDTWPLRKCSLLELCRALTGLARSVLYCQSPESLMPSFPRAKWFWPGSWSQIPRWLWEMPAGTRKNDGRIQYLVCLTPSPSVHRGQNSWK